MHIEILIGVVCVAICILFVMKGRKQKHLDQEQIVSKNAKTQKSFVTDSEEKNKREDLKLQQEISEAGNRVYSYINGLTKQMCCRYRENEWDSFSTFEVSQSINEKDILLVKMLLKEKEKSLLDEILDCISIEQNTVLNKEELKKVFYCMVLPFYPAYFYVFGEEIRYTAFLNRLTLNLFYQLSGKKFKVGYRNKYHNGVVAFSWDKDVYTVFDKDGKVVCKASFKNGKVYNGFGVEPIENEDLDWKVEKVGTFKEGKFQSGELNYKYQKACQ